TTSSLRLLINTRLSAATGALARDIAFEADRRVLSEPLASVSATALASCRRVITRGNALAKAQTEPAQQRARYTSRIKDGPSEYCVSRLENLYSASPPVQPFLFTRPVATPVASRDTVPFVQWLPAPYSRRTDAHDRWPSCSISTAH